MAEQDKNSPSYCCAAYHAMMHSWQIMQDTTGGTPKLREKGIAYLPKEPAEKEDPYFYRLRRAVFFNAVDLTLAGLVGMVFRNDPKLAENVPELIRGKEAEGEDGAAVEGQWENVDNAGTHGAVFTKELFTDAMRDGHAAILVDMPPALEEGSTFADEQAAGRRPYWVSYCADQIINWRTKVVNGQTMLDLIVFKECSKEPDGDYGEKDVTRYRVLTPGQWALFIETKGENGQKQIVPDPDNPGGPTSLTEIPVAIVYSRKKGILESQPPLIDLAYTNIAHYQKYSDFSIYMHIASRPILCRRGADPNKPVTTIGPFTVFDVATEGDVWYAETTGAALAGAAQDIKDLEERMSIMGLSLLVKRTGGPITATEEKGDQIEESSDLATAARSLKDGVELALKYHAQYLNPKADTGGNIDLGAALDVQELTPEEMTVWTNMVAAGQCDLETMWGVFEAGGKTPADFDINSLKKAVMAEKKERMTMEGEMMAKFERGPDDEDDSE